MTLGRLYALFATTIVAGMGAAVAYTYPLDGYQDTGIRRLEYARLVQAGELSGPGQPSGALLGTQQVQLRLPNRDIELPQPDVELGGALVKLLGDEADAYSVALLDLSDPNQPVYAQHRDTHRQNVGSIGKVLVAVGLLQALADTHVDVTQRQQLMREHQVVADEFAHSDHHTIRLYDVERRKLERRAMQDGDTGNLWEYLDWTLSASSNSAASMAMREAMLLRHLGTGYPVDGATAVSTLADLTAQNRTELFQQTFWQPLTENGLSLATIRQGSFFTKGGQRRVSGGGNSYASARSLVRLMLKMEQGQLVDSWSSLQLKRLLYSTERRIRYASAPTLLNTAVYFKSGSLYSCVEEEGFQCRAYRGNQRNYMNSMAVVEAQGQNESLHYIAVVLSNVLKKNAAQDHQALAGQIHTLVRARRSP